MDIVCPIGGKLFDTFRIDKKALLKAFQQSLFFLGIAMKELTQKTFQEIIDLITDKQLKCQDFLQACWQQIQKHNNTYHASCINLSKLASCKKA